MRHDRAKTGSTTEASPHQVRGRPSPDHAFKAKELFTQRIFVLLLGRLYLVADVLFFEVRAFPFVDFGNRMID